MPAGFLYLVSSSNPNPNPNSSPYDDSNYNVNSSLGLAGRLRSSKALPSGLDDSKFKKLCFALSELFKDPNSCRGFGRFSDLPTAFFIKGSSVTGLKFSSEKQEKNNGEGVFDQHSDYDCGLVWPAGCAFFDFLANGGNSNLDPNLLRVIRKMRISKGGKSSVAIDGEPSVGYSLHLSENWKTFFPNGYFHIDICKLIEEFCELGHEINFIMVKDKACIPAEDRLVELGANIDSELLQAAEDRHRERKADVQKRVDYQKRSACSNDPDKLAKEMANVYTFTWRGGGVELVAKNYQQENDESAFTPFFDMLSNLPKANLTCENVV